MIQLVILSGLSLSELLQWDARDIATLWVHYEAQLKAMKGKGGI